MYCKNCGAQLPENAAFCGKCGAKLEAAAEAEIKASAIPEEINENTVSEVLPSEEKPQEESGTPESGKASGPSEDQGGETVTQDPSEEDIFAEPKKKKRSCLPFVIAAVVVLAIIAGAVIAFFPYVANTAMRLASPEKHQAYIYKNAAKDLAEGYLCGAVDAMTRIDGKSADGKIEIDISSEAVELIESESELDLSALENVDIDFEYSVNGNDQAIDLSSELSDITLNAELRTNSKKNEATLYLPEFNKNALEIDGDELEVKFAPFFTVLPEKEYMVSALCDYTEFLLLNARDVKRGAKNTEINGHSVKATCFETEITNELAKDAAIAVLEKAKTDKELEKYITDRVIPYASYDEDIDYEDYIDDLIEDTEEWYEETEEEGSLFLYTYVNAKGEIIAVKLEDDTDLLFIGRYQKGKNVYYEIEIIADYEDEEDDHIVILAEGTLIKDKLSIEADYSYNDEEMLSITVTGFDLKALKEGCIKGDIEIGGEAFADAFDEKALKNITVKIEADNTKEETDTSVKILMKKGELASVRIESKLKDTKKIKLHEDAVSDAEEWSEDISTGQILKLLTLFGYNPYGEMDLSQTEEL
ncbi:MAG: zinc ribbon domain-containing protein [Ruminococcaceae bacterium]|nr:zinc ribbon domain-containing protein [Oscillospiraceae bacterium]